MIAYLQNTNEHCQAAVQHMYHSHDKNEYVELVKTFSWYNLHISLQPTTKKVWIITSSSETGLWIPHTFVSDSHRTVVNSGKKCDYPNRCFMFVLVLVFGQGQQVQVGHHWMSFLKNWSPFGANQDDERNYVSPIGHHSKLASPLSVSPVSDSSYALELWTCAHEVKSERIHLQESLETM